MLVVLAGWRARTEGLFDHWGTALGLAAAEARRLTNGLATLARRSPLAGLLEAPEALHSVAAAREGERHAPLQLVLHFRFLDLSPTQCGGCSE